MPNGRSPQQIFFSIGLTVALAFAAAGLLVLVLSLIFGG